MRGIAQGYATSEGAGKRPLITPDEAKRLGIEEILIYHAGQQMLRAKRCGYIYHPFYKAGLPEPAPLAKFPTTEEIYGPYHSIFEDYSDNDLNQQKVWNAVNSKLMGKHSDETERTTAAPKQSQPVKENKRSDAVAPPTQEPQTKESRNPRPPASSSAKQGQTYMRRPSPYASVQNTDKKSSSTSSRQTGKKKGKEPPVHDKTSQNSLTGISDTFNMNI